MPGGKKAIPGASPKFERMYHDIKKSELSRGADKATAERIAAATTNKERAMSGDTKKDK